VGTAEASVTDVTSDSRKVRDGSLFACIKGSRVDGHDFAGDAAKRGASVIVSERAINTPDPVTQVIVDDSRRALAYVSSRFFGEPSEQLTVVGITGTNGKTTTVHLVRSIIEASGHSVGVLGTLGHWIGNRMETDAFTTPESPELHRYLRSMVESGIGICVMEVSSHAIALCRVNNVAFDVVCFTNLTRDHLDFHHSFDEYRRTKMKLFAIGDEDCFFGGNRRAAVNIGDDSGAAIRSLSPLSTLGYCLGADADVRGDILYLGHDGLKLEIQHAGRATTLETGLRGKMNAENIVAAYSISLLLGIEAEHIREGIARVQAIPGRMEAITGRGMCAIVDYAHTPDALRGLLGDVRQISGGSIICVFGCGGDRDAGKRPEMGKIASESADRLIVTSDNPRTEDPMKIIQDIVAGIPEGTDYEVVPDRAEAIETAVAAGTEGDTIVIAGKGHEDYQIIGDRKIKFDDREVVKKVLGVDADARAQHR
jgi:UDP-N-acetylmuramoyl-L-alanyl-D-glutamate--2,6-diaminopimelate ligase